MSTQVPNARKRPDKRIVALRRFAISITAFSIVGRALLGFEQSWLQWGVALAAAYAFELGLDTVDAWARRRPPSYRGGGLGKLVHFLLPTHIAATSIAFLIYPGERLFPFVFATAIAIGSKYVFRAPVNGRSRHVFNPSNLGIAVTLALFSWVGPAPPYHFTEYTSGALDWIIPLALLGSGLLLNVRLTGKGPLIAAWSVGFVAQAAVRDVVVGDEMITVLAMMTGPAYLLYTNYMITDPGTTPSRPRNQVAFGLVTAAIYGLLASWGIVFGLFFSLVLVCALRGLVLYALAVRTHLRSTSQPEPAPPVEWVPPTLAREGGA